MGFEFATATRIVFGRGAARDLYVPMCDMPLVITRA